jgi:hypothetical protein
MSILICCCDEFHKNRNVCEDVSTVDSLLLPLTFRKKCGQLLEPRPNERQPQEPRLLVARHRDGKADRSSSRFIPGWVFQATERSVYTQLLTLTVNNIRTIVLDAHYEKCHTFASKVIQITFLLFHLVKSLKRKFFDAKFYKLVQAWICRQTCVSMYTAYEVISRLSSLSKFLL